MNEQAIKDSYELFKTGGYSKSYEEFVELINSNPQALEDSYTLFKTGGYNKSMEEYEELMGVKKKRWNFRVHCGGGRYGISIATSTRVWLVGCFRSARS